MSALVDRLVGQVLSMEISLWACQARVRALTDSEALHDLRITVRRLRSLLRPLRGLPGVDTLEQAAADVGRLTTPIRDREVLAAYLHEHDLHEPANRRTAQLAREYVEVANSVELAKLLQVIDAFPRFLRAAEHQGLLKGLRKRIEKRLSKQWNALDEALHDPAHDRHRLRLLIKRVRYAAEAYPELDRLPKAATSRLKAAQSALGDWHDCWQWLAQAEVQPDLQPCVPGWRLNMARAEGRADQVLEKLSVACFSGKGRDAA